MSQAPFQALVGLLLLLPVSSGCRTAGRQDIYIAPTPVELDEEDEIGAHSLVEGIAVTLEASEASVVEAVETLVMYVPDDERDDKSTLFPAVRFIALAGSTEVGARTVPDLKFVAVEGYGTGINEPRTIYANIPVSKRPESLQVIFINDSGALTSGGTYSVQEAVHGFCSKRPSLPFCRSDDASTNTSTSTSILSQ